MSIRAWVVERPLRPPYCFVSNLLDIVVSSHFPIIDSNILLSVGVSDIGLMSVSIDFGGLVFGNGTTFAHFHACGITPVLSDELNI